MSSFLNAIEKFIKRQQLIRPGQTILAAVSGGPDSMALLVGLLKLKGDLGCHLIVGHINHGLRASAKRDELYVKTFCKQHHVPFFRASVHLKSKLKNRSSIEDLAREARYHKLIEFAQRHHADKIALGHHRDDLAETVLMRILRGSGLQGLQAILPERKLYGFNMIRPILNVSREEILHFLKTEQIAFCEDETNQSDIFFRNKIRHKLIPLLRQDFQPQIREILANLAVTVGEDFDYLKGQAARLLPKLIHSKSKMSLCLHIGRLQKAPLSLGRMGIRLALEYWRADEQALSLAHLLEIEDLMNYRPAGSQVHLSQNLKVTKTDKTLTFTILKSLH